MLLPGLGAPGGTGAAIVTESNQILKLNILVLLLQQNIKLTLTTQSKSEIRSPESGKLREKNVRSEMWNWGVLESGGEYYDYYYVIFKGRLIRVIVFLFITKTITEAVQFFLLLSDLE